MRVEGLMLDGEAKPMTAAAPRKLSPKRVNIGLGPKKVVEAANSRDSALDASQMDIKAAVMVQGPPPPDQLRTLASFVGIQPNVVIEKADTSELEEDVRPLRCMPRFPSRAAEGLGRRPKQCSWHSIV